MSRTQVALRFPRAFPRLFTSTVGGMGLWCSELPTSTSIGRFLARRPSPGPVGSPPRGVHRGCHRLACRRALTARLPGAKTARPLRCVARSKTHLAPARFGTTERLLQGCPKIRPSIDITTGVHSRVPASCLTWPLRQVAASDPHVPPSWSLTTSTAFSTDGSWACCIPLPILGFIGFQPCVAPSRGAFSTGIPSDAIPSRAFPTRSAVPASLLAVAFLSFRAAFLVLPSPVDFKALLRASVRCREPPLPAVHARCSPGLPCF